MAFVYLSLGSNLGDKEKNLKMALKELKARNIWIKAISRVYKAEPVGNTNQDWFLNLCVFVDTRYPPETLLIKCLDVEDAMGRKRTPGQSEQMEEKWGPRIIDVDVIFYEDLVFNEPHLILPHPRMHERKFVLKPLDEIAPLFVHPVFHKTVHRLLMECKDSSIVEPFSRISFPKQTRYDSR